MGVEKRATGPFISALRNMLLGRKYNQALRFEPEQSPRSPPPANLPEGVYAKLSSNYYLKRDARRESKPPVVIVDSSKRRPVASGKASAGKGVGELKPVPVPGRGYIWKNSS